MSETPAWQGELYDLLKNEFDVSQFSYVPDAGHRELINRSIICFGQFIISWSQ